MVTADSHHNESQFRERLNETGSPLKRPWLNTSQYCSLKIHNPRLWPVDLHRAKRADCAVGGSLIIYFINIKTNKEKNSSNSSSKAIGWFMRPQLAGALVICRKPWQWPCIFSLPSRAIYSFVVLHLVLWWWCCVIRKDQDRCCLLAWLPAYAIAMMLAAAAAVVVRPPRNLLLFDCLGASATRPEKMCVAINTRKEAPKPSNNK